MNLIFFKSHLHYFNPLLVPTPLLRPPSSYGLNPTLLPPLPAHHQSVPLSHPALLGVGPITSRTALLRRTTSLAREVPGRSWSRRIVKRGASLAVEDNCPPVCHQIANAAKWAMSQDGRFRQMGDVVMRSRYQLPLKKSREVFNSCQ